MKYTIKKNESFPLLLANDYLQQTKERGNQNSQFEERLAPQWLKNKQRSTKHYTEN